MTVVDFLKKQKAQPALALVFLPDLLRLLDCFGSESCFTLASKLRDQMKQEAVNKRGGEVKQQ